MGAASRPFRRYTAAVLSFFVLFVQFAHAATPSHRLAALQRTAQAAPATPATSARPFASPSLPTPSLPTPSTPLSPAASPAPPPSPEEVARTRLLAAHTVFLARQTQDAHFPATADEAYNHVLASLRAWGHYQVVDNLAHADLVLQLRDTVHASVIDGTFPDNSATVAYLPGFQLTVADPATLTPLWVVNVPVAAGLRSKGTVDLLAVSSHNLISQLKLLVGEPLTSGDQASLKKVRGYGFNKKLAFLLVGAGAAVSLGLFFAFRHAAQSNQAAFCAAHGISPCPGS